MTRPRLSVIVTSYRSPELLERCLQSLSPQEAIDEIIVADCSPDDPTRTLRKLFPAVRVLHFDDKRTVPQLRWSAVSQATGDLVAALEARCVATLTWSADLVRAHQQQAQAPAVGGPVRLKRDPSLFDWGLYFAEYACFAPPLAEGAVRQISGANLSYKREALEGAGDLLHAGTWEALLHERWLHDGRRLYMSTATVEFHNGMRVIDALRMRFHYGRSYAAGRFAPDAKLRRLIYGLGSAVLPALLTWRARGCARRASQTRAFRLSLPWILMFNTAWAAGECVGCLAGPSSRPEIY